MPVRLINSRWLLHWGCAKNCYKAGVFAAFTVAVLQERCKLLYRLIC